MTVPAPGSLSEQRAAANTNENISLSALAVTGSVSISANGGNISFGNLDVGSALTLEVKNGDISGAIVGGYDDFAIQSNSKKGGTNLPEQKDGGRKNLNVSSNNGDVNIEFITQ